MRFALGSREFQPRLADEPVPGAGLAKPRVDLCALPVIVRIYECASTVMPSVRLAQRLLRIRVLSIPPGRRCQPQVNHARLVERVDVATSKLARKFKLVERLLVLATVTVNFTQIQRGTSSLRLVGLRVRNRCVSAPRRDPHTLAGGAQNAGRDFAVYRLC